MFCPKQVIIHWVYSESIDTLRLAYSSHAPDPCTIITTLFLSTGSLSPSGSTGLLDRPLSRGQRSVGVLVHPARCHKNLILPCSLPPLLLSLSHLPVELYRQRRWGGVRSERPSRE